MELTHSACYQAVQAHDFRFDGLFFTCVSSTHIYCRPVYKAQVPKPENCSFVKTAAAAEKAGFRSCLRCRLELAPAMRRDAQLPAQQLAGYIDETLLLDETLSSAVRQYPVSERHLRRLFVPKAALPDTPAVWKVKRAYCNLKIFHIKHNRYKGNV